MEINIQRNQMSVDYEIQHMKTLWEDWNIRITVLSSLFLQILLIGLAPFRKWTSRRITTVFVWLAYLLADATANFAIGLIFNGQCNDDHPYNNALLAFWAPFLLLHLGGPDTITAYSLEDNQLWIRHLLAFITQSLSIAYVFAKAFSKNNLVIPTFLVFVAGIIKYLERTFSLYLASKDKFRESMIRKPNPGINYAKHAENSSSRPGEFEPKKPKSRKKTMATTQRFTKLNDVEIVVRAYDYFKTFKGLFVDLIFSFSERDESRCFFNSISAVDALKVLAVELNFMYGVLYTKVDVVHWKWGMIFRLVSTSSVLAALAVFRFHVKKHHFFDNLDVEITYALLLGALVLDFIAIIMVIFSDRTVIYVNEWNVKHSISKEKEREVSPLFLKLVHLKGLRLKTNESNKFTALITPIPFRRWSESVSGHNLIKYRVKQCPSKKNIRFFWLGKVKEYCGKLWNEVIIHTGCKEFMDHIRYVFSDKLTMEIWEFIFSEMQVKSWLIDDVETSRNIYAARGDWVLSSQGMDKDQSELMSYVLGVSYDESVLMWHVATELLYNDRSSLDGKSTENHREFSKIISDYMLYLLIMQPAMMAGVGGIVKLRYEDTCVDADRFFKRRGITSNSLKKACKMILEVDTELKPTDVRGDGSTSVLFTASMLAKELKKLKDKKWEIISKVWVEMLGFAASHCSPIAHAQQLSKGGELVTFVWLLMTHFGLGNQFQSNISLLSQG